MTKLGRVLFRIHVISVTSNQYYNFRRAPAVGSKIVPISNVLSALRPLIWRYRRVFKLEAAPLGYTNRHITELHMWMEIRVLPSFTSPVRPTPRERVTHALYLIRPFSHVPRYTAAAVARRRTPAAATSTTRESQKGR